MMTRLRCDKAFTDSQGEDNGGQTRGRECDEAQCLPVAERLRVESI